MVHNDKKQSGRLFGCWGGVGFTWKISTESPFRFHVEMDFLRGGNKRMYYLFNNLFLIMWSINFITGKTITVPKIAPSAKYMRAFASTSLLKG